MSAMGKTVVLALYALLLALGAAGAVRMTQHLAVRIEAVPTLAQLLAVGGTAEQPGPALLRGGGLS